MGFSVGCMTAATASETTWAVKGARARCVLRAEYDYYYQKQNYTNDRVRKTSTTTTTSTTETISSIANDAITPRPETQALEGTAQ